MIIRTTGGEVRGRREDDTYAFLGVPYAEPITPSRRFTAPEPRAPWHDVWDSTEPSGVCPQIATYGPVGHGATSVLSTSTDFLTLNIRTPSPDGAAPVLVWIHGGGYALGSANEPILQTGAFARSGVVEVTVNYRLGVLGFLRLDDRPDNRGLLDQLLALEWIRDNIARFGGDPARVTLAGRSAGGFSVATLMAMPAAAGLFARTLVQSGASPAVLPPKTADRVTARFAAALGVSAEEPLAEALESSPIEHLLDAQRLVCDQSYTEHDFERDREVAMLGVPLQPVIDGSSLPRHPEAAAAAGATVPVPMIIGGTTGEYVTHATMHPDLDAEQVVRRLDPRVAPIGLTGADIVDRYRTVLPGHSPIGIWRAVGGDLVFDAPAVRFAELHGRHQPVIKYRYGPDADDELGAPHGAEVGEVWHRPDGTIPELITDRHRPADPAFARLVHDTWVSFVRDDEPVAGGVPCPRYDDDHQVLRLDRPGVRVEPDPSVPRTALWEPEYGRSGIADR